ncbi:heavy metal translocating P-type ATPase [Frigidibacter sp. SD6-1]|uniref:heavy metal translocating P-type ATPase n=1 Tax=Frigidibacter sp. SD6-1 TaxID=3032581 RepID=UPI0024DFF532|nr:heavy metal translocating P-type ATPase [Frigidibacter sp. SD6-1]
MSLAEPLSLSACPACVALPATEMLVQSRMRAASEGIVLSIPEAKDGMAMAAIERRLAAEPGVLSARVNLTRRRVSVVAAPEVLPERLISVLEEVGQPAFELDPGLLTTTDSERRGRDLLMRLGVAGFAMMNIMLLSVAVWSGAEDATRDLFHWISAMIALPTLVFAGQPFFASALASIRARRLGMDVPISLALILSSAVSLYETVMGGEHAYFDAGVSLCFFLLIGRYLDYRSRAQARSAAEELAALEVPRAIRLDADGEARLVPVADVLPGDLVLVRPGARMPVDGVVEAGASETDRSLLTGETRPVAVETGALVSAGEVNLTGPLQVRVQAAGASSSLHRLADLVAVAESAKNRYISLADRMARRYSPMVHLLALGAFLFWITRTHDMRLALNIASAVLIITCPCALALAVPSVVTSASGRLFRKGLLVKDGTALERLAEVSHVVFDKTGTLTMGAPEPANLDSLTSEEARVALALADGSAHPLSRALAEGLKARNVSPAVVTDLREIAGYGVEGLWQGGRVRLGRAAWVGAEAAEGSASYLAVGAARKALIFTDRLRPGAEEAVAALKAAGLGVTLLSGDAEGPVAGLARLLGIETWQSGMLPAEKAAHIEGQKAKGAHVLMVGDGLNDTVALASAHVSVSPASALDAARTASDIVLLGQSLAPIAEARTIAVRARARIKENFALSLGYNALAVPVALAGFATPLIAAFAMSTSSLLVTLNALRLK